MGVAFDANKVVEQKTMKQKIIQKMKNENDLEPIFKEEKTAPVDSDVVKKLESEVKEMEDNRTSCKHFILISQNMSQNIVRISALASKMGQI